VSSLKRRAAADGATKQNVDPSSSKDGVKEEACINAVPSPPRNPARNRPLLVAGAGGLSKDSESSGNTSEAEYHQVDRTDRNSLTYRRDNEAIMRKTARSGDAPRLPASFGVGLTDMLARVGVEPTGNHAELFRICKFKLV
jgi:hypothetical protein